MADFLTDIAERSLSVGQAVRPRPVTAYETLQTAGAAGSPQKWEAEGDYPPSAPDGNAGATTAYGGEPGGRRGADTISPRESEPYRFTPREAQLSAAARPIEPTEMQFGQDPSGVASRPSPLPTENMDHHPNEPALSGETGWESGNRPLAKPSPLKTVPVSGESASDHAALCPSFPVSIAPMGASREGQPKMPSPASMGPGGGIELPDTESENPGHISMIPGEAAESLVPKPMVESVGHDMPAHPPLPRQPAAPPDSGMGNLWERKNELLQTERPTPTIHVTIGRIEVRATQAPVQKEPRPRGRDAMSLDEYLHRRNGERR